MNVIEYIEILKKWAIDPELVIQDETGELTPGFAQLSEEFKRDHSALVQNKEGDLEHRLYLDFGVGDNYSIIIKTESIEQTYKEIFELFKEKGYLVGESGSPRTGFLKHPRRRVQVALKDYVMGGIILTEIYVGTEEEKRLGKIHNEFQERVYNMGLMMLTGSQAGKDHDSWAVCMAGPLAEFLEYLMQKGYAFCLPTSMGANHSNDASRVVYHPEDLCPMVSSA